jgi:hypothetical protein
MPAPKTKKGIKLWRKRISESLMGNTPWNKGKRLVDVYYQERMRANKKYYLNELKQNALRRLKQGYDKKRVDECNEFNRLRAERCGYFGRQNWNSKEIKFLKEHWNTMFYETLAKKMARSYSSILHKAHRLGLKKYHKWI